MRFAASAIRRLDGVVSSLASGTGSEAAADLLPYGVRFVLLSRTADAARGRALVRALDGVPGLVPVSGSATSRAWKVDLPVGRARVLRDLTTAGSSSEPGKVLPAGAVDVHAEVPPGPPARWVVLAESRDTGWRGTLGGSPLRARTYDGWAQAFALPPAGGTLHIDFDQGYRSALLWVQLAALVGCVVLTLPSARPSEDTDDGLSRATMASSGRRARQPAQTRS
jgi:hypothetical protein